MRFLSVIVFGFFIYFMYLCKSKVMFDPILNDLYFGFFTQGPTCYFNCRIPTQ